MDKSFFLASASLTGAIIGAGVFAIPFVIAQAGVLTTLAYFLVLGLIALSLHFFLADIVIFTKSKHRLAGYAEKYLGKTGKIITTVATLLGSLGALLVYLILSGKFLSLLLPISALQATFVSWALFSLFLFFGVKLVSILNFWAEALLFLVVLVIFSFALPEVSLANFVLTDKAFLFLPFGVLLFSLVGWSAIPEAAEMLKDKKQLKKAVLISFLISICFYIAFGLVISGVSGKLTTEEAFSGLVLFLGKKIIFLAALFGLFNILDSFLIVALYLKNTLKLDWKVPALLSFLIVSLTPLALFLSGVNSFIGVIAVVGVLTGLVEGIIICLIYQKTLFKTFSKRKASFVKALLIFIPLILFLGFLAEVSKYIF